jgi:hypothetical protein
MKSLSGLLGSIVFTKDELEILPLSLFNFVTKTKRMKNVIFLFFVLLLAVSRCPTCKANDQRVKDEVLSQYEASQVTIIWNDHVPQTGNTLLKGFEFANMPWRFLFLFFANLE